MRKLPINYYLLIKTNYLYRDLPTLTPYKVKKDLVNIYNRQKDVIKQEFK